MDHGRRSVLGLALLGTMHSLAAARALPAGVGDHPLGLLSDQRRGQLEQELAEIARDPSCELASLAVLAIRDGKISYEGEYGRRFIGNSSGTGALPDQPVERDTLFRIASISKMMTTLGLLRLVEQGKLELDADVSRYLGFQLRNPHFPDTAITVRHLLTHTSSLRDDAGYSWGTDTAMKDVLVPGARLYGDGKMWGANAGPGAYFTYCNLGFGLVGTIMERVTQERFDRLMARLL